MNKSRPIEILTRPELDGNRQPTLPSLVWPGSTEAVERGCICGSPENDKRLKAGKSPVLSSACRVHSKLCTAGPCGCQTSDQNREGNHLGAHFRCDHCNNFLHLCGVCEAVYLEDGDDPSLAGWKLEWVTGSKMYYWRCRRCQ